MNFQNVNVTDYITVIDMGFIWRRSKSNSDERNKTDGTCYTWGAYAEKVFKLILQRHSNATNFFIVNDYYGSDVINPKDGERNKIK